MFNMKGNIMSVIGLNIKKAREKKSISTKELAKKAGISESALIDVEIGKKVPNTQIIQSVSKVLGISVDDIEPSYFSDFFEEEVAKEIKHTPKPKSRAYSSVASTSVPTQNPNEVADTSIGNAFSKVANKIPVILKINPAKPFPLGQDILDYKLEPVFQGKNLGAPQGEFVYFISPDNSMSNSRILKGDIVLILITKTILDKDIVLAVCNGKTYLRRIKKIEDKKILLFPDNPEAEVIIASQTDVKVYGKAVRAEFRL